MKVSKHAAERFLERVMERANYSYRDIDYSIRYLEKLLSSVVPNSRSMRFVLPGFENFKVIYREGCVITIISKGERYV